MRTKKWINENTASLAGKRVAVTGSTGGIGCELCEHLASLGAELVLVDRNPDRSKALGDALLKKHASLKVEYIKADMEDIVSVRSATNRLKELRPYAVIFNAGAYSIPRHKCSTGYDNVFQINFLSPYYMTKELLSTLREYGGRIVAVGSVAHNYSVSDVADVDFSTRTKASLVYGNAKRYLMFALHELFREEKDAHLAVTHPGITFTNITAHYPKVIFALIKHPMKVIFMKPRRACLSILAGLFEETGYHEWIGPGIFDVWGLPKKRGLSTCPAEESLRIFETAEKMYDDMKKNNSF